MKSDKGFFVVMSPTTGELLATEAHHHMIQMILY